MSLKVLVVNSGSSSIKFELYQMPEEKVEARGLLQRIGEPGSELKCRIGNEELVVARSVPDHAVGLKLIMDTLTDSANGGLKDISEIGAVGHRVVHGGSAFSETVLIDDEVLKAIEERSALAPLHNPPNLLGIEVARQLLPNVPQVAVFDTAFHQTMPDYAYAYAIPWELNEQDHIRRYGFHGTSHRYVAARAARLLGRLPSETNLITCHLGNGCSITAIRRGASVDTSMGLTPLEGLVMGTRSGDIDPALFTHLARTKGLGVKEIDTLLNKKSGLLGLSGLSNDVRTLLAASKEGHGGAVRALAIYAYRIKKYIGAYTAALGTVHALVFTAGVGENSPAIRERSLDQMAPLGYRLDKAKNEQAVRREMDIAEASSPIRILVIPTNEELLIAQDTYRLAAKA